MFKGKKGLSDVVTTLIIILLSLVAIGVVWVVVQNLLSEGAEGVDIGQFSVDVNFVSASINGDDVTMTVRRTSGQGDVTGLRFVLSDGLNSEEFTEEGSLTQLQTKTFTVTLDSLNPSNIEVAQVAPVYTSSNGEDVVGGITDTFNFGRGGGSGNGNGNEGEGEPGTGICGDGIIQVPNGDDISEQCDGTNLGNPTETCFSQGFAGGILSCNSQCQFDTSQCTQGTPDSCDTSWIPPEDAGVVCDGGANCQLDCMCSIGFTADGTGGCTLNPQVNTGTINTVWNSIYFDSNNLPRSSATMTSYINYYVNFSSSPEISCFEITFADYVEDTDISYLRLDDSLGFPNIASGETYHVWEAENCGLP